MARLHSPRAVTAPSDHPRRRRHQARPAVEGLEGRALLSTILALTNKNSFLVFDSASPSTPSAGLPITGLPSGENMVAIDFAAGSEQVYGLGSKGHLYAINISSGAATAISTTSFSTGLSGSVFSMDDNPVTGLIRIVDDSGQNFRVDPSTGAVAGTDTALAYASGDPNAGKTPDVVGLAYTNQGTGQTTTTALALDASTGTLDRLGSVGGSPTSPNSGQLTTIGGLGVPIEAVPGASYGFDVVGTTNSAFAVLTPSSGANSGKPVLYSINLGTGAATAVGVVGDGATDILGIAASTLQAPGTPTLAATSETSPVKGSHITNITTPTITGTALAGATVWIFANGNLVGQGTASATGTYAITTAKLADGSYNIQAIQFDASGLPSGFSPAMTPPLIVITATPAAPSIPDLIASDDTGFSDTDHYTSVNDPTFTGTAEPGAKVFLFANYALVGLGSAGADGSYTITSKALLDGAYLVQASQLDLAGNLSPASPPMTPHLVIDTSTRPTPQEAYIGALYNDLFGRPVDAGGLQAWQAVLAGSNGRNNVVSGLLRSTGYLDQVAKTTYQTLLGRLPTSTELAGAEKLLATERIELFKAQVAGTNEFYTLAGGTTAGFLARLGQTILGQPIDSTSLATYTAQLNAGASRTAVAYEVLTSPAGYTATVHQIYASLQQTPTAAQIAAGVASLQAGGTDQQLIQSIAVTDTFFATAQGNAEAIFQWTSQVFTDLFGITPSPSGLATVNGQLLTGQITPLKVVQIFESSPEYRQIEVTKVYVTILGRAPDAPSLAAWSAYLAAGGSIEGMKATLLGSAEFTARVGGTANALAAMYAYVTGLTPSAAVLSSMQSQVASGISITQIASSLLYSPTGTMYTVASIYGIYLRRTPRYSEINGIAVALGSGAITDQEIIADIVTSDEYFSGL